MRKQLIAGLLATSLVFMSTAPASAAGYKQITDIQNTVKSDSTPTDFTATLDMFETTVTIPASLTLSWNSNSKALEAKDYIFARGFIPDGHDLLVYTDKYITYTKEGTSGSSAVKTGDASIRLGDYDISVLFDKSQMERLQDNNGRGSGRSLNVNLPISNVPAVGTYNSSIIFKIFKSPNAVAVDSLVGKSFELVDGKYNFDLSNLDTSKGYRLSINFDSSFTSWGKGELSVNNRDVSAYCDPFERDKRYIVITVKPGATFDTLSLSNAITSAKCTSATIQYLS